nr:reverse transcriptase domain-containing protein [Tanacetum cinerariifolium]
MLKYKNVPKDAIKLMLFPFSLEGAARNWLEKEPPRSIHTWEDLVSNEAWDHFEDLLRKCPHHGFSELHQIDTFYNSLTQSDQDSLNAAAGGNLLSYTPRDALTIIENKSKVRTSRNKPVISKVNTTTSSSSPFSDITALTDIVKELVLMNKANQQASVKAIEETCVTCGGPHSYYECLATDSNTFNASAATGTYNQGGNIYCPQGDSNYHVSNQMGPPSFPPPIMQNNQNCKTVANPRGDVKAISTRSGVAYDGPMIPHTPSPLLKEVEHETEATKDKVQTTNPESTTHVHPLVVQVPTPEPKVVPKPNPKPSIPYPSRLNDQKLREKTNSQMLKFLQIFQRLHFDLSFADAFLHIPKDPGRFLIPCDFQALESCMALADLAGIAEDVFVQVGKFTFPADFVVVDYDVDPRVPLILGRPFLRMARALVDVHEKELILREGDEKLIFYADSTPKHPHKHGNESINMINFINITCEDRFPKVLKFKKSNHPSSGSTTPLFDFSPSLTPFETSDSLLEELADELTLLDPFLPGKEDNNFNFEADLREIEYLLNQDPSTESNFETIDLILEKFTDKPALDYLPPPRDDDDDVFDLKSDSDKWKKLLYGDRYKDIDSEKDKNKDSKIKSLVVEAHIVESNDLLPQLLDNDPTLPEESSEIAFLSSSPFRNEDKLFNPGRLILGRIQILKYESKDKDLRDKDLILKEHNFLSISSYKERLFFWS